MKIVLTKDADERTVELKNNIRLHTTHRFGGYVDIHLLNTDAVTHAQGRVDIKDLREFCEAYSKACAF